MFYKEKIMDRNQKFIKTKNKIEKAFIELIDEKGFEQVSVSDICDRASLNRTTFYTHYFNINDLLEKLENEKMMELTNRFTDKELNNNFEKIRAALSFVKENKSFYKIYFRMTPNLNILDNYVPPKFYYDYMNIPKNISKEDYDICVSFFKFGLAGLMIKWIEGGCKESADELNQLLSIFNIKL